MSETIREIMTTDVITVKVNDSVIKAAQIMSHYNIGAVPVMDANNQIVGILTDRDIVLRTVANGGNLDQVQIQQVMTTNIVTTSPGAGIDEASQLMASQQIRRLPVVENDRLLGMVSLGDLATDRTAADEAGDALHQISEGS